MKRNSTPKANTQKKERKEMQPKASTIDFILGYAASYEAPKNNLGLPGFVLN